LCLSQTLHFLPNFHFVYSPGEFAIVQILFSPCDVDGEIQKVRVSSEVWMLGCRSRAFSPLVLPPLSRKVAHSFRYALNVGFTPRIIDN
jgi:hypothetical protein